MCSDAVIRRMAGLFTMASVALGHWVHPGFYLFTAFVGFNLVQSSFTGFCLPERVFGRLRLFGCQPRRA